MTESPHRSGLVTSMFASHVVVSGFMPWPDIHLVLHDLQIQKISQKDSSKAPVPLGQIFFQIYQNRDKFSNREQSKTNRNNENARTIYPNIYNYVSDYMKIHHDHFRTFYGQFANKIVGD